MSPCDSLTSYPDQAVRGFSSLRPRTDDPGAIGGRRMRLDKSSSSPTPLLCDESARMIFTWRGNTSSKDVERMARVALFGLARDKAAADGDGGGGGTIADAEFLHNPPRMELYSDLGDPHGTRDLLVRRAFGQHAQYLELARRQRDRAAYDGRSRRHSVARRVGERVG